MERGINHLAMKDGIYPSDNFWYIKTQRPPLIYDAFHLRIYG
ncbi:hypothetical protein VCRA2122O339_50149 [Vibrio crassostreae]|nr:hypothetical protein VCRA2120E331_10151 [Vibrio crassostreae]CAK3294514.1 hypothetical protein VCRA2127O345_10151 [Vibrio crassostreae]CAK3307183.1 hypothetical protein VCRA2120E330_10151 [Vibrio crassostreae]CAK3330753.1 hypothetical protein VCRA2122O338_10151 [Vibrio crassostreae]CAK3394996.1 hypothetical protein VCRA2122O340_10135 [Vibrio crassostreae]